MCLKNLNYDKLAIKVRNLKAPKEINTYVTHFFSMIIEMPSENLITTAFCIILAS